MTNTEAIERAMRIADAAAEEMIRSGYDEVAFTSYLFRATEVEDSLLDCIEHLAWRGMASKTESGDGFVSVRFTGDEGHMP
jgi:hypothetical protein